MAQSGQYNYKRSLDRCNPATAACARYEFIKAAIAMVYLLNKKYMPFINGLITGFNIYRLYQICMEKLPP